MKFVLKSLKVIVSFSIVILLIFVFIQKLNGNEVSILGLHLYRVSSGSMVPDYQIGDIILVQNTYYENLNCGDDITYLSKSGKTEGLLITHRIIKKPYINDNDEIRLQTMGIAQGAVPDEEIAVDQIVGKVIYRFTLLTMIYKLFLTKFGLLIFIVPIIGMMLVEIINIVKVLKNGGEDNEE